MKVYFLSSEPCALTLNDVYFGVTDTFERFIEIDPKDRIFARFSPQNKLSIGFFITEELRFSAPEGCDVYLLPDGIAIYVWDFLFRDVAMHILLQERHNDTLYTVFCQGRLQMSIQTRENFSIAYLPPSFLRCKLFFYDELCILEGENTLAVYNQEGNCLLLEKFLTYSIENDVLNATLPLSDCQNRIAECSWQLQGNTCTRVHFSIRFLGEACRLPTNLLPYAFFESVLIGGDYVAFLSDELKEKARSLTEFLGEYLSVVLTDDEKRIGLVKKRRERVFDVVYYTVELEKGKIVDIHT
jgi:hypothetical protein